MKYEKMNNEISSIYMQRDYLDKNHKNLVKLLSDINLLVDKKHKTKKDIFMLETKKHKFSEDLFNITEQYNQLFSEFVSNNNNITNEMPWHNL